MPKAGTGLAGELGIKRRDDPVAYNRAWKERNRERSAKYAREYHAKRMQDGTDYAERKRGYSKVARRKAKYHITRDCYEAMLTAQGGNCNICGDHYGDQLRVDHDHVTGEVRALLCSNCNSGLGLFQEDPVRMQQAIRYLELYQRREKGE